MTDREKLIDLAHDYFKSVPWYADIADLNPEELIDYLLANGVRLETKQATSDENKRWIPVSERLPNFYESVLVNIPDEKPCPTVHEGFLEENGTWYVRMFRYNLKEVTHWMPLPEPPKEDVHD